MELELWKPDKFLVSITC